MTMSFEEILSMPVSDIKPPEAHPVGTYHCIIDGHGEPGKSSQKGTPYIRFKFKILKAMDDVDAQQAAEQQVVGKILTNDYYITDATSYGTNQLKDMLIHHLGLEADNLKELISMAPGRQLLVKLRHENSPDGKRIFHRVESTAHV